MKNYMYGIIFISNFEKGKIINMKLAENLKKCRQNKSLTQNKLANKLHVSRKTISNWENGRSQPSFQMLNILSKIYEVPTVNLLNGSSKKPNGKVLISYYLNITLFVISVLSHFFVRHTHIPLIITLMLLINLIYLFVHYKDWSPNIIGNKVGTVCLIFISFVFAMIDSFVYSQIGFPNIVKNSPYFQGAFLGSATHILIMTLSFFMILFLSKNLRFLFNGQLNNKHKIH